MEYRLLSFTDIKTYSKSRLRRMIDWSCCDQPQEDSTICAKSPPILFPENQHQTPGDNKPPCPTHNMWPAIFVWMLSEQLSTHLAGRTGASPSHLCCLWPPVQSLCAANSAHIFLKLTPGTRMQYYCCVSLVSSLTAGCRYRRQKQ